ncbi:MAG: TraR/DksA family transcriptional regulator [Bacteroidales bacterium]|jgi:RNA polymerase-binding transcription factor DksA|nr:TraR/DksA family transcriptional regulator [Bacteroidales bacterium]
MGTSNLNTVRYSDEELQEFKAIILEKLAKAKENLETLTEAFANNASDTSDTSPTFKILEEGSSVRSKEDNANMAARQQKFIKDLEAALIRIENKTYGICRATGKLIPKERLRIVPHATLSVEAKLMQNKK